MASLNKERKRGRPPKHMIISKPNKHVIEKKDNEEQLVLFLPTFDDTNSDKKTENDFLSVTESESKPKNKFKHLTEKDSNSDDEDNVKKIQYKNNINIEKLIDELQKKDALILNLKSKLKDKSIYNENVLNNTKDNKKKLINLGLITVNNNKLKIEEHTDIACWWCTYNFDTLPLFCPDHYKNNVYYVFGNFCSFSCMLAYNENLDDYRKSVRTGLIKQLYRELFNNDDMNIKPSAPREVLTKFGGNVDITKYRDPTIVCTKTMKITIPPMIPLISECEEIVFDK